MNNLAETLNHLYRAAFLDDTADYKRKSQAIFELANFVAQNQITLDEPTVEILAKKTNEFLEQSGQMLDISEKFSIIKSVQQLYGKKRQKQFKILIPQLIKLFKSLVSDHSLPEEIASNAYDWVFALCWQQMDNFYDTSLLIKENLVEPYSNYLDEIRFKPQADTKISQNRKLRICYLIQHFSVSGSYANGRAIYSLLQGHFLNNSEDIEIYLYITGATEISLLPTVLSYNNVIVRNLENHTNSSEKLEKIKKAAAKDQIDILITEMYFSSNIKYLKSRLAPIQMYLSCGFIPLTIPEVDYYLLFDNLYGDACGYPIEKTRLLSFPYPLSREFLCPAIDRECIKQERMKYPGAKIIFGSLCRLEKVTNEYLLAVKEILNQVPDSILIIGGPNDKERIVHFLGANNLSNRVFLPGMVDAHLYGYVFDIYLETFPFGQGMAAVEVMAKSVPVVKVKSPGMTAIEVHQRDPDLLCEDSNDYVEKVVRLINDPSYYLKCREKAAQIIDYVADVKSAAQTIEQHCWQAINKTSLDS